MATGRIQIALALLMTTLVGCSTWVRQPVDDQVLPPPMLSSQTVVLEIAFVHLTFEDHEAEALTWAKLDEQALPVELRQSLAHNGLRVGIAGTQLPPALRELVERTTEQLKQAPAGDDVAGAEIATLARQRRLQVRGGKRAKVIVSSTLPAISVLGKDQQGRVQGDSFRDAQCLFSLKATPEGDGRTILELAPEIEHGELKNRWIPLDGGIVQQVGKDREVYDQLRIAAKLTPGQTLVVGPTEPAYGLGKHFFTLDAPVPRRTLLLIRVAQTQRDELFEGASSEPGPLME